MTIADVETNELLNLINLPVPPRKLGRRTGPWNQFQRFLAEEGLKPARNGKNVPVAPVCAMYKFYKHWVSQFSPQPPTIIPPMQFSWFLRKSKFKRNLRDKKGYTDVRLIGGTYETAKRVREFLAEHPLEAADVWLFNPQRKWRHPKRRVDPSR